MKMVVCVLAIIGLAAVVKHISTMNYEEGCCICNWCMPKKEDEK
jgi:hypothetical protein